MRIFVDPARLAEGELAISGDEHHYLARVRRARTGDALELLDGAGRRASAVIARITDTETIVRVSAAELIPARPPHVRTLIPLIKGDRMELCLEKLVEVGVDEIVVFAAARSVVRLAGDKRDARLAKYRAALVAAARQSGRAQVPRVSHAELATALDSLPTGGARLVLDPGTDEPLAAVTAGDVTIASGPEGGLTPDELSQLAAAGFTAIGLGPHVLRAETAPVIAVALLRAGARG